MTRIKILLADDHSLMRMGLTTLLSMKKDMSVVGEAATGGEAVRLVRELRPDVVIMDLMMPDLSGADATKQIRDEFPETKVLVLTSFGSSDDLARAIANGATGVLTKDIESKEIVRTIRLLAAGQTAIPAELQKRADASASSLPLSKRHLEILELVAKGFSNPEIADHFGISLITVKKHLSVVLDRLGASSRSEAVAIALKKQLLKT